MERVLWSHWFNPSVRLALEWKPADLWVGLYWRREGQHGPRGTYDVWLCLVPTLPVHLTWRRGMQQEQQRWEAQMRAKGER